MQEYIKNYVYYLYEDFLASRNQLDISKSFDDLISRYRNLAQKNTGKVASASTIQQIEDNLNRFFNPNKTGTQGVNNEITQQAIDKIETAIAQWVGTSIDNINWDTGGINTIHGTPNFLNMSTLDKSALATVQSAHKTEWGQGQYFDKKLLENRVSALLKLRDSIKPGANTDLVTKLDQLANLWDNLSVTILRGIKSRGSVSDLLASTQGSSFVDSNKDFISALNELIEEFWINNSSFYAGRVAEAQVALAGYTLEELAQLEADEIVKIIYQNTEGTSSSYNAIKLDNFTGLNMNMVFSANWKMRDNYIKPMSFTEEIDSGIMAAIHRTQDKVDSVVTINGLKIPASVKNYNFAAQGYKTGTVTLLKGASPLFYVQDEWDFVENFLNVYSEHGNKNNAILNQCNTARKVGIDALRAIILAKALRGGVLTLNSNGELGRSKTAELFIINDSSVGKYRVYDTNDMLNSLIWKLKDTTTLNKTVLMPGIDDITEFNSDWIGEAGVPNEANAMTRANAVFSAFNAIKFQVEVSLNFFKT